MSDAKQFQVNIVTTATGDGAEKTAADLQAVKTAAAEAAPAVEALAAAEEKMAATTAARRAGGSSLASDPVAFMAQGDSQEAEKLTAAEERRNSLIQQRQAIISTETEAMALQLAGREEEAAALDGELAVMRESYALQTKALLTEEEATAPAPGLGRNTGLLAALGPEVLIASIAIEGLIKLFEHLGKASEEATKKVAEANKAAAESVKELAEASKRSLAEAKAEAQAYVSALKSINESDEKGLERYQKEQDLATRRSLNQIDQKEIGDLAKAPDDVAREKIKAQAEKDRVQVKADAEVEASNQKVNAAKREDENTGEMYVKAWGAAYDAQKDFESKTGKAAASKKGAEEARRERVKAEQTDAASASLNMGVHNWEQTHAVEESKKNEAAAKALAADDQTKMDAAQSRRDQLTKTVEDLDKARADNAKKVTDAKNESAVVSDEAAVKVARAAGAHDKAVLEAEKREADREREKKDHEHQATVEGGREIGREDKIEGAVEKGAGKGVEAGIAKHGHHHSAPGSRIHAPGAHGDQHALPHDGLGNHDAKATDFDAQFHKHLPGAGDPGFRKAFQPRDPDDAPWIDTRTSAEKKGTQTAHDREAEGAIGDAQQIIRSAQARPDHERMQPLIDTLKESTAHLKDLKGANKDDTRWKELHRALQDQAAEIKALRDLFKNNVS
jgi:hypothetical protein